MKKIMVALMIVFAILVCVACEQINPNDSSILGNTDGSVGLSPNNNESDTIDTSNNSDVKYPDSENQAANGGASTSICDVHVRQAHEFTDGLIRYVGEDEFMEWIEDGEILNVTEGCRQPTHTIYEFIKFFDIPRNVFEEVYYTECYNLDYFDVDLFYSGDDEAVEMFLRDKETAEKILGKRFAFGELKYGVYVTYEKEFREKFGDISYHKVTFADMVRELSVPRELLEDYASKTTTGRSYDYNFDLLYLDQSDSLQLSTEEFSEFERFNSMMLEAAKDPYPVLAADAIICGVDDYCTE